MKDKITCFKLNWCNCGLCSVDSVHQEEISIYRKDSYMAFKTLNGYGVICSCEIIHIEKDKSNQFFEFLEEIYDEWKTDYKVDICDGSEWSICMWHSSHKVKKIYGASACPPYGKKIEKYIRSFILNGKSLIDPKLFGDGDL